MKTKLNFSLTEKCFPLTNFFNVKQTQENLKNIFPEKFEKWFSKNHFSKNKHGSKLILD
jgi:hypothetical protein